MLPYNGTMLDGGIITIGSNTQVGPNCQFLTPNHPIDYVERRKPIERCSPITIGEDCWLGGGVTVCPGVTIGENAVVTAGAVVTKDVAPWHDCGWHLRKPRAAKCPIGHRLRKQGRKQKKLYIAKGRVKRTQR